MSIDYTENMFKAGDWVHTVDGIGIITNVFPVYQQYWEKESEDSSRIETWGKDQDVAIKIFGKVPETGDWIKDLITVKRLCNHDAEPMSRTMCFSSMAFASDKINKKELSKVNKILKDIKIKKRFEKFQCKYGEESRAWKVLIPPERAVEIKHALDNLEGNKDASLSMTMKDIESYIKNEFDVDIFKLAYPNNVAIHTRTLLRNNSNFYNKDREILFSQISIYKQRYNSNHIEELIENHNINESYFNQEDWINQGWDGEERGY